MLEFRKKVLPVCGNEALPEERSNRWVLGRPTANPWMGKKCGPLCAGNQNHFLMAFCEGK